MSKTGKSTPQDSEKGERLQKVLAAAGIGSRRQCEEYIVAGRVTVDGEVVQELGTSVNPSRQRIELDGERVRSNRKLYYVVNKPVGVLCTNRDPAGRPRVIDLFPAKGPRLFTVGRLDENSQGLLVVTNDGELANKLAHPRYRVLRTYRVQVAGIPTQATLDSLKRGLHFAEGTFRVQRVRKVRTQGKSTLLEIVLSGGQNREIRRLMARVGHKVMRLERVSFGTLKLGRLPTGHYRALTSAEVEALRNLCAPKASPKSSDRASSSRRTRSRSKVRK